LPSFMRIVVVPEGDPQTKPRALNYALSLARGDYVVIYDAEDRPEKDQLRRALMEFERHGPKLACVQSCLNIFNPRQSWLTRQFTVEYSALFDCVLPALQWLGIPIPLGGTSNHFPRAVLEQLQGWDPYNVTEDADLGIRIARRGYDVAAISSTTWEEAPATFKLWRNQRTRWIKGWIQTYLVHTRRPAALWRDLGFLRTLGFHLYMGGLILSALVHPIFYIIVAADVLFGVQIFAFNETIGPVFWTVAVGNLLTGYVTSIIVGVVSVRRRRHKLTLSPLMMPFYWLLISFAAYRALWQLYWDPFRWEKTPHGLAEEPDEAVA
jgi:glycosyltransferase XagB